MTLLSVDEILLPKYANWSINFKGLPLRVEMTTSHLKHMYSVLFVFKFAVCSRLCSRESAWQLHLQEEQGYLHSLLDMVFLPFECKCVFFYEINRPLENLVYVDYKQI